MYEKHIDEDVIIAPYNFILKLEDQIKPSYVGKASLVMRDITICNQTVDFADINDAKRFFINEFLDHFIGWNFGIVIKENSDLEKELLKFNKLVIKKGIRKKADSGLAVFCNENVQPYDFQME